ncbi:MAG: glycosyltransferase [Nitrospira sp.]|nr:glycosyltransferase [Nitrospira sp.]
MRILVLQAGRCEYFLAAAHAVRERYPLAALIGLAREADLAEVRQACFFEELHPLPENLSRLRATPGTTASADLCVVPFEDRFGIRYWNVRLVPIRLGIPKILSCNSRGQSQAWSRAGWIATSVVACVGLRAVHILYGAARQVWGWVRRRLDVAGLFALAGIGLVLRPLQAIGFHPLSGYLRRRLTSEPRRLVLFIPSLGLGGAQRQLASYLEHLDRTKWEPEVVTLDTLDKFFEPEIRRLGVPITFLNPHCRFATLGVVGQLVRHLYRSPCEVLHSWLHHAVALGAIAGTLVGIPTVVGSLRSGRPGRFPWFYPKWQRGIDVLTAPLQTRLIVNSNAVRREHRRWAFVRDRKLLTVYNGVEADELSVPDGSARDQLKAGLQVSADSPCVGIVGRLSREKDHATFLKAAAAIARVRPDTRFLIVGDGPMRGTIEGGIERLGLTGLAFVLGERRDVPALMELMDVLVLTSVTEGMPNVLLEAAVTGTPAVTTAAGGSAEVVVDGVTGFVTPCGDAEAVAQRVLTLLGDAGLRGRMGAAAVARVKACFSADQTSAQIAACYEEVPVA